MITYAKKLAGLLTICTLFGCQGEPDHSSPEVALAEALHVGCTAEAKETDGLRRLALLVGVGDYEHPSIDDLDGPPNDVRRIYHLLTDHDGYGFPRENVCVLLNEQATTARFKEMFARSLVSRAKENDVAVVFFAGHGSRKLDVNGDESGRWDSTLMLHDARTEGIGDLVDDEFNQMLVQLYQKTNQIVVMMDSCHSGTATRGGSGYVARYQAPEGDDANAPPGLDGDDAGWIPVSMPEAVMMAAAADDSTALEKDGRGLFTEALWQVMSQANDSDRPLTYAQLARQVPQLLAAYTYQVPYFHGKLHRAVFQNTDRTKPIGWDVRKIGPPLELSGPPWPGMSKGAELRIFDGAVTGADTRDPARAKATVVIEEATGVNATARVISAPQDTSEVRIGDLAVLVRPGDTAGSIKVRLRPGSEAGGIKPDRAEALRKQVAENPEARMFVSFVDSGEDLELSVSSDNSLLLLDANRRPRNRFSTDAGIADSLWHHARQRALRQLRGETGADYTNDETLQVELVPSDKQTKCANGIWVQAEPNTEQVMPICHAWNVKVTMKETTGPSLLVGAVILSSDGSSYALPADGRKVLLKDGESVTFNDRRETFVAAPPLDVQDQVIVFGTQESNPVPWHLLTSTAQTRSGRGPTSGLYRALDRYLLPGTRAQLQRLDVVEDTTWTTSSVTMRVEANSRFLKPGMATTNEQRQREYTIKNFDIRPYLPDDPETALYRALMQADKLATASISDGYSYRQHDWSLPTTEENLRKGIDCSRAIWYVFKESGLPYNRKDTYLPTVSMVSRDSWMKDKFDRCALSDLRTGDILVYRDDERGDGHTVMVIDPNRRIAWGSHGWDGTPRDLPVEPDTGVEYQLIKYKKDWQRWDREKMLLKSCWRYRTFAEETATGRGLPGLKALDPSTVCSPGKQCGLAIGRRAPDHLAVTGHSPSVRKAPSGRDGYSPR